MMLKIKQNAATKFEAWSNAVFEPVGMCLELLAAALEPKVWPTWLRRAYLLTAPAALPLHGVLWVTFAGLVAIALVIWASLYVVARAMHFWIGDKR